MIYTTTPTSTGRIGTRCYVAGIPGRALLNCNHPLPQITTNCPAPGIHCGIVYDYLNAQVDRRLLWLVQIFTTESYVDGH